mgnify:CR=1 FL=1
MEARSNHEYEPLTELQERPAKYFYLAAGMRLAVDLVKIALIRLGQYTYAKYAEDIYYNSLPYEVSVTVLFNAYVLVVFPLVNCITCKYEMSLEDSRWKTVSLYVVYIIFGLSF